MASFRKRGGKWHTQVRKKNAPTITKTFTKKTDAEAWARQIEVDLEKGVYEVVQEAAEIRLGDLLDRYQVEIAPTKKAVGWTDTLSKPIRGQLGSLNVAQLSPSKIAHYRDQRLLSCSAQTVKHEVCFIGRLLKVASMEWGLSLPNGNPVDRVAKPRLPRGRDRRISVDEEVVILRELTSTPRVRLAVMLALETAMRRSEIIKIDWRHVDLKRRVLHIPETKTDTPRTIPLSTRSIRILQYVRCQGVDKPFDMAPKSLSQAFVRACKRAGVEDLRFHDLRHEAVSRLFERGLNPMEVAAISGHKTLQMLKRYTHLRAEDLAKKLG